MEEGSAAISTGHFNQLLTNGFDPGVPNKANFLTLNFKPDQVKSAR
jgi:hypothetical protein